MTYRHLLFKECFKHRYRVYRDHLLKDEICGCPRTTRTDGLVVYKHGLTDNWVVWDVRGQTWLSLSGVWETAMKTANLYLKHYPPEPERCQARCSQWPNCQHDWRRWHIVVENGHEA